MVAVSIFVGGVQPLPVSGRPTGMYKMRVVEPINLGPEGFHGDQQADRKVHGGLEKAVHLYPARHYAALAAKYPAAASALVPGSIGENLSTCEIDEGNVRIGEVWQLGDARIQVCQPRSPCWKIDERFACDGMAKFIASAALTGWYWRVTRPGSVGIDATLERVQPAVSAPTLREAMQLCQEHRPPLDELERLAATPGIAGAWRARILQRLDWFRSAD